MAAPTTRRSIVRWLPLVVAVAAITVVTMSASVSQWWGDQSTPATSSLPASAGSVLRARPRSSNADVHTVLWFVAALALVWAMRAQSWRRLAAAAVALWLLTAVLEVAQRWVPNRTPQWIDVVGNGLGIVAGLAIGCAVAVARMRFGGRVQQGDSRRVNGA